MSKKDSKNNRKVVATASSAPSTLTSSSISAIQPNPAFVKVDPQKPIGTATTTTPLAASAMEKIPQIQSPEVQQVNYLSLVGVDFAFEPFVIIFIRIFPLCHIQFVAQLPNLPTYLSQKFAPKLLMDRPKIALDANTKNVAGETTSPTSKCQLN